ncbi:MULTISPECIES: cytochrome (ubi)quinol oxidase subunit III [Bradyrhizobium]|uniref:Cytochrome bo(3) ubiquinol oxidase subunit 3 n=1 Tax=Bradyrhizobium elkanii TaxID=29448 RepID=A0A4U6S3V2_BRAEL|nr:MULTISPECIES: cytochrome (ubi)quinol oxidase subunit III [Bradyrhizobium]MTV16194.1 cytochrome (ubi)quinol oxidase subunit III [Bradyrhizobium sp. BR2003]TKV81920.1 cytochrome (ubi)quinol oxidase subunit III [Bradyrhizobium elkanii]
MNVLVDADSVRTAEVLDVSEAGPAPKRIIAGFGFWIFLLSDIVMFSALFASYAVLAKATASGPSGGQLFDLRNAAMETAFLLLSSYSCGLMSLAINSRHQLGTAFGAVVTFLLGAAFLNLELREFQDMIAVGASPQRSAFLSAFFTLVGCHGLHVAVGLAWLVLMMVQLSMRGFQQVLVRRLHCFSLFWHALDIIWVLIFTIVYLMGVLP